MRWHDLDDPTAFAKYMESVDARLRDEGVDIPSRPIHAMGLISGELKISFALGSEVERRINGWFEARYADRLKIDFTLGRMLVLVDGDVYVARFPVVFGTAKLNLLQVVEGVTPATLTALAPADVQCLVQLAKDGFEAFVALADLPPALLADGHSSITQAMARPPNLGMSRWSSQQLVEKVLNAFVERKGGDVKRARKGGTHAHDFAPLVAEAQRCGLAPPDATLLKRVECTANIRYSEREEGRAVTLVDAVEANQASVFLCAAVARQW